MKKIISLILVTVMVISLIVDSTMAILIYAAETEITTETPQDFVVGSDVILTAGKDDSCNRS